MVAAPQPISAARLYGTAFIGLFFDYYDLYLFIYLERTLNDAFALTPAAGQLLQFVGLAGVGCGALVFGGLADRWGRGRVLLAVFGVYVAGIAGLSLAWDGWSLGAFRLLASLALGAEWGISHTLLAERLERAARYRFAALLQLAILGGLLAALARSQALPVLGWRWLFAASLPPVAVLSLLRWRLLAGEPAPARASPAPAAEWRRSARAFAVCFGLAALTIASGTINVFFAKDLPQSTLYTAAFWLNVVPGLFLGAWAVRRWGVGPVLVAYAAGLAGLSLWAWASDWPGRTLAFALLLPVLNGLPFGLMGAFFNEVFGPWRTLLSGTAYNVGRIAGAFAPALIAGLGLHRDSRYFLFTAALGAGVAGLAWAARRLAVRL